MRLAAERSRIAVYTFAEGLLSALAHDLEIVADAATGEASGEESAATAEVRVTPASLRVSGVMKRGKLDTSVLSSSDRESIQRQIREEVLAGGDIVARGSPGASPSRASIEVRSARGVNRVTCDVAVTRENGTVRAKGSTELSLRALGSPPVKGPVGAFRVKDRVRVEFDLLFVSP